MNIKRILLIVFAVLIIIGSLGVMIRFSVPATKKPQNNNNDDSLIVEPADITEFYDFENAMEWESIGGNHYANNATVYLKSGNFNDNEGTFDFTIYESQMSTLKSPYLDPYIVIGNTYVLEEYSKIVYEVDVKVTEDYPFQIVIRPDYRDGAYEGSYVASLSSGIVCYSKGEFYVKETTDVLHTIDADEFHFSYVVNTDGSCQIYVNSELIYETDMAYAANCYQIKGLRLSAQYSPDEVITGTAKVSFDNIHVKGYFAEETTIPAAN